MLIALIVAGALVFASPLPAGVQDAKPDFSGKWSLDVAKSDFGQMPPPDSILSVIDHKEPNIRITTTQKGQQGEVTNERVMTTDGKDNVNTLKTMGGDQQVTSTTRWNGKVLATAFQLKFQDLLLDISEAMELSADGMVLTVTRNIKTEQGDFGQKTVFSKQ